jgi:hypothetical protein
LIWIKTAPPAQLESSVHICQTSGVDCENASSDSSASESSPVESAVTDVSDDGGVDSANLIESWDS